MKKKPFAFFIFILLTIYSCSVKRSIKHGRLVVSYYNGNDSLLYLVSGLKFIPENKEYKSFYADVTYQYAGNHPDSAVFNFTLITHQKKFPVKKVALPRQNYTSTQIEKFFSQPYKKKWFQHRYSFKMPENTWKNLLENPMQATLVINDSLNYFPSKKFRKQAEYSLRQLMFNEE